MTQETHIDTRPLSEQFNEAVALGREIFGPELTKKLKWLEGISTRLTLEKNALSPSAWAERIPGAVPPHPDFIRAKEDSIKIVQEIYVALVRTVLRGPGA